MLTARGPNRRAAQRRNGTSEYSSAGEIVLQCVKKMTYPMKASAIIRAAASSHNSIDLCESKERGLAQLNTAGVKVRNAIASEKKNIRQLVRKKPGMANPPTNVPMNGPSNIAKSEYFASAFRVLRRGTPSKQYPRPTVMMMTSTASARIYRAAVEGERPACRS